MKSYKELKETADFICEYATLLMGSGVHTSRVTRNSVRLAEALEVKAELTLFQTSIILTIKDKSGRLDYSETINVPQLPVNFEINSDLSALSWEAFDNHLTLSEVKEKYARLIARPAINKWLVRILISLGNASFCKLFGGNWIAMVMVFAATFAGIILKQEMLHRKVNAYITNIASAFAASLIASATLLLDAVNAEVAIGTSILFLIPGVPLLNGIIDIVEGHTLTGFSRLTNALLLILCLSVGLSFTILLFRDYIQWIG